MGDMADMYNDWYDRWGDHDEPTDVQCRRCKKGGFTWHDTGVRWALIDDAGKLHECGTVAKLSDFEDLSK
jgi:hypothetical protein